MRKITASVALLALAFAVAACSKKEETPGEKLDKAIDKAAEKGEAVKDALKK